MRSSEFHRTYVLLILMVLVLNAGCVQQSGEAEEKGNGIRFTDVTEAAGLAAFHHDNGASGNKLYPEMMGSGGGFIDYDGDGWLDILLMGGGRWEGNSQPGYKPLWLFRNNGDGTFTDQSSIAGLNALDAYTIGMAVADYDNDGDDDFFLTNLRENMLFRNNEGVFTEVGDEAGIAGHQIWSSSPLFFDADRDGHTDLYVGNYVDWSLESDKFCPEGGRVKLYCIPANYDGIASQYYHNNGDGTFTEQTNEAGFSPAPGKSLGVVALDINEDGWPDMAVANDGEGDLLYVNRGNGVFDEQGVQSGFAFSEHGEARAGMGIDAGVVDSSGQHVIFVGNFSEETVGVYRHTGGGLFVDQAATSRVGHASLLVLTFGLFLFDVDLDTDLDLFAANGHVYPDRLENQDKVTFRQRSQLYLNRGNGLFDEFVAEDGPLTQMMVARGAAYGDIDRDGDLDVLVTENNGPAHLWRNDQQGGRFLRVGIEGVQSNRSGLGARVEVELNGLRMERRIRTGSSYLSQSELVAVFGLGENTEVDSVVVYWPSGVVDHFGTVAGNQEIRIIEGAESFERIPLASR